MDKEMMESVVKTLKSDLVQVTGPNPEEVADLVQQAKGETRTLKEFAEATGISAPTLSRIMNGKITRPLTPETIVSIINASESNTLRTMYELARASGYLSAAEQKALRARYKLRDTRNGAYMAVKSIMHTTIIAELLQRGGDMDRRLLEAEPGELFTAIEQVVKYDFAIDVCTETEEYKWVFFTFPQKVEDFSSSGITADRLARNIIRELSPVFLTDAWLPAQYNGFKISFCFVDREMFEAFSQLVENGRLNNSFSAVLIDDERARLNEEVSFKTAKTHASIFERPLQMAINFSDDEVADEVGECNFLFVQDGEEG